MLAHYHAVREAASQIAAAIDFSRAALHEGRVEQEPAFTDRMLGAIEQSLEGFRTHGLSWRAKTLTDRGRHSQEHRFGADFMGVLSIDVPSFRVEKGFLAQAKLVRDDSAHDFRGLEAQCRRMLSLSPASFVFLYNPKWVRVVPAISVLASRESPLELYSRSAQRFFEEHLQCFIGDGAIREATPGNLEDLRDRFEARSAILIRTTEGA